MDSFNLDIHLIGQNLPIRVYLYQIIFRYRDLEKRLNFIPENTQIE